MLRRIGMWMPSLFSAQATEYLALFTSQVFAWIMVMLFCVCRARHNHQVLWAIVLTVGIDVMNHLAQTQRATISLLPYKAMLKHIPLYILGMLRGVDDYIATRSNLTPALEQMMAWAALACRIMTMQIGKAIHTPEISGLAASVELWHRLAATTGTECIWGNTIGRADFTALRQSGLLKMGRFIADRLVLMMWLRRDFLITPALARRHRLNLIAS